MDKKTDYAIRAAIYLALNYSKEYNLSTAEIADGSGSPRKFLAQILLALKNKALIKSTAGRNGGYKLMRRPELISLAEITSAVENNNGISEIVENEATTTSICKTASLIAEQRSKSVRQNLMRNISLADLLTETKKQVNNNS